MSKNSEKLFSAGEFAALCGTTKETLYHYDSLGILKPARKDANGYRKYSAFQFFEFDLIRVLKQSGSNLSEIKDYVENPSPLRFKERMISSARRLEKESKRLFAMAGVLSSAAEIAEYAVSAKKEVPFVEQCAQEYLFTMPVSGYTDNDVVRDFKRHFENIEDREGVRKFPVGAIVAHSDVLNGVYKERCYFSFTDEFINSAETVIKPAGTYASFIHNGGYIDSAAVMRKLLNFIEEKGYKLSGDLYEYDLISYAAAQSEENYILKYSARMAPRNKAKY